MPAILIYSASSKSTVRLLFLLILLPGVRITLSMVGNPILGVGMRTSRYPAVTNHRTMTFHSSLTHSDLTHTATELYNLVRLTRQLGPYPVDLLSNHLYHQETFKETLFTGSDRP